MKKVLSILGAISLVGISTTSLIACKDNIHKYKTEELVKLKEKNKINTDKQEIKDNLEWIAPQEKSFNQVDNKWYYVVWRGNENNDWKIIKFKNVTFLSDKQTKKIDFKNNYELFLYKAPYFPIDLVIGKTNNIVSIVQWREYLKNKTYFKSVYRWNSDTKEPDLILDKNGNVKVNEK
ncbi:lipoprotein [Spiroplasma endosymbiont of Phyllotreta cruciferae]|uniref:lipoprotein n=1 Tax=Spiroplasma endosymbiont of Phyllotreta cruciferae TaxID=2886375 RepID=UPI0020A05E7C|nr:lipoprotein [Spiroplasma endosymbiont of Phyllotreta cruciferae]